MELGVCVGIKLFNRYLLEWVRWYRSLGFDLIIILDNNETDGEKPSDVLGDDSGIVIYDKRGDHGLNRQNHYYTEIYNDFKDKLDYLLFCDDDEFLNINPRFRDAKDWIGSIDPGDADCICLNWRMFTDNGQLHYSDRPVLERFTEPCRYETLAGYSFPQDCHVKTIVHCQGKPLEFNHPHFCVDTRGIPLKSINASGKPIKPSIPFCDYDFECASLDHFQTKSTEEFCNRRLSRKRMHDGRRFDGCYADPRKEIQLYFSLNRYTDEKMDLIRTFLKNEGITIDESHGIEHVLAISHQADLSGAPLALLSKMKAAPAYRRFTTILLEDGPARAEFEKIGPVMLPELKSSMGKKILRRFFPKTYAGVMKTGIHHPPVQRLIRRFFPRMYETPVQLIAEKDCYDVIYANTAISLKAGIELKQKLQIPLIAHIHEAEYVLRLHKASAEQFQECDAVIACSDKVKNDLMNLCSVPKDKILVQSPVSGTMLDFLDAGPVTHTGGTFRIATAGTDIWRKGLDFVPAIAGRMKKEHPEIPVRFVMFGDFPEWDKDRIVHDLKHAGCQDYVIFMSAEQYRSEITQCDALLLLSREDPFPLVAQENALLAHPIILFEGACGVTEWLDRQACIQVPYLDTVAATEAIVRLYSDGDFARSVGMCARRIVEQKARDAIREQGVLPTLHNFYHAF